MRVKSVFDMYNDAGHGWLKVQYHLIEKMGLTQNITPYSRQHGIDVFLEEDCDAPMFIRKYREMFEREPLIRQHYTDKRSRIRNYNNYNAN